MTAVRIPADIRSTVLDSVCDLADHYRNVFETTSDEAAKSLSYRYGVIADMVVADMIFDEYSLGMINDALQLCFDDWTKPDGELNDLERALIIVRNLY
jgi:hypothetical protein